VVETTVADTDSPVTLMWSMGDEMDTRLFFWISGVGRSRTSSWNKTLDPSSESSSLSEGEVTASVSFGKATEVTRCASSASNFFVLPRFPLSLFASDSA